ncbi:MAG TPA: hypothetical protein EYP07_12900 [Kiloniellaceae bacterium]|uniref:hypothetical protein n=1 Tax=Pelagibius sp. TaxID=1931238 RepID=UPI0017506C3C|nr:hypothetical protein [Kiloniellaceae bacterium]
MQIQPSPVPLANTGTTQSVVPEAPPAAKSDSARPVESAPKDPPPRFPYPDPDRGQKIDFEA